MVLTKELFCACVASLLLVLTYAAPSGEPITKTAPTEQLKTAQSYGYGYSSPWGGWGGGWGGYGGYGGFGGYGGYGGWGYGGWGYGYPYWGLNGGYGGYWG